MAGASTTWIDSLYCDDCSEWKYNGNFGAYINIFPTKTLSLTYALSAFSPWLYDDIKCYENGYQDCSLTFDFPYIFAQYFGVSYLFTKHIQSSLGVKVYLGNAFSERLWNLESKTSFMFWDKRSNVEWNTLGIIACVLLLMKRRFRHGGRNDIIDRGECLIC